MESTPRDDSAAPPGDEREPVSIEQARERRRARPARKTPTRGGDVVSFEGAAQRVSAREALIAKIKADVQTGEYHPDPMSTAKAMERRSED